MLDVLNALSTLYKLTPKDLNLKETDLDQILHRVIEAEQTIAHERNVKLDYSMDGTSLVVTDPDLLFELIRQIAQN